MLERLSSSLRRRDDPILTLAAVAGTSRGCLRLCLLKRLILRDCEAQGGGGHVPHGAGNPATLVLESYGQSGTTTSRVSALPHWPGPFDFVHRRQVDRDRRIPMVFAVHTPKLYRQVPRVAQVVVDEDRVRVPFTSWQAINRERVPWRYLTIQQDDSQLVRDQ